MLFNPSPDKNTDRPLIVDVDANGKQFTKAKLLRQYALLTATSPDLGQGRRRSLSAS